MKNQIRLSSVHSWPPVYENGQGYRLSFKILTPFRLNICKNLVIEPVQALWKFTILLLIADRILAQFHVRSLFYSTPVSNTELCIITAGLFVLWNMDRFSRLSISRLVIGKRIRIQISPDKILVGGWLFNRRFNRAGLTTFSHHNMGHSQCQIYSNSTGIYVIQNDEIQYKIGEIFDLTKASDIVTNLNATLALDGHAHDLDLDPMKRVLA